MLARSVSIAGVSREPLEILPRASSKDTDRFAQASAVAECVRNTVSTSGSAEPSSLAGSLTSIRIPQLRMMWATWGSLSNGFMLTKQPPACATAKMLTTASRDFSRYTPTRSPRRRPAFLSA